jgi:hypothetical protein
MLSTAKISRKSAFIVYTFSVEPFSVEVSEADSYEFFIFSDDTQKCTVINVVVIINVVTAINVINKYHKYAKESADNC